MKVPTNKPDIAITDLDELGAIGGSVIIGFQCTSRDEDAALRIYQTIDKVFELLIRVICEERISTPSIRPGYDRIVELLSAPLVDDPNYWIRQLPVGKVFSETGSRVIAPHVYEIVGYDQKTGQRVRKSGRNKGTEPSKLTLDLHPGRPVRITSGVDNNCKGRVDCHYSNADGGHIEVTVQVLRKFRDEDGRVKRRFGETNRVLGIWQIVSAMEGKLSILPIVNDIIEIDGDDA